MAGFFQFGLCFRHVVVVVVYGFLLQMMASNAIVLAVVNFLSEIITFLGKLFVAGVLVLVLSCAVGVLLKMAVTAII
jgi:hypothetical protein